MALSIRYLAFSNILCSFKRGSNSRLYNIILDFNSNSIIAIIAVGNQVRGGVADDKLTKMGLFNWVDSN
jgi:hypothetical protein